MDEILGQNTVSVQDIPAIKEVDKSIFRKIRGNLSLRNILLVLFILMPVISVEGLIPWSIGIIGASRTISVYRSNRSDKNKRALIIFLICSFITLLYNLVVHYITGILVPLLV